MSIKITDNSAVNENGLTFATIAPEDGDKFPLYASYVFPAASSDAFVADLKDTLNGVEGGATNAYARAVSNIYAPELYRLNQVMKNKDLHGQKKAAIPSHVRVFFAKKYESGNIDIIGVDVTAMALAQAGKEAGDGGVTFDVDSGPETIDGVFGYPSASFRRVIKAVTKNEVDRLKGWVAVAAIQNDLLFSDTKIASRFMGVTASATYEEMENMDNARYIVSRAWMDAVTSPDTGGLEFPVGAEYDNKILGDEIEVLGENSLGEMAILSTVARAHECSEIVDIGKGEIEKMREGGLDEESCKDMLREAMINARSLAERAFCGPLALMLMRGGLTDGFKMNNEPLDEL